MHQLVHVPAKLRTVIEGFFHGQPFAAHHRSLHGSPHALLPRLPQIPADVSPFVQVMQVGDDVKTLQAQFGQDFAPRRDPCPAVPGVQVWAGSAPST